MDKFPKIRYPGDSETDGLKNDYIVVTEKFDGANFRFTVNEDLNLITGSRNVKFVEDGEPLPIEDINSAFRHAVRYLRSELDDQDRENIYENEITLYGEAMHLHSIEYDVEYENPQSGSPYFKNEPNVILFDAKWGDDWFTWGEFEHLVEYLGLERVPVIEHGNPSSLDFNIPDEGKYGPIEGIVARRYDGAVRAKKVSEDFKEKNATSFNDESKAQTDAGEFVAMFVTDARIKKTAHKLVDEGKWEELEMSMMEDLPRAVLNDVFEEEGWDTLLTDGSIDWEWNEDFQSEVRSKASKKCARVLKTELQQF